MSVRDFAEQVCFAFRREPWVVTMVVVAIGLGIGASTAMVAVLRALMVNPVPAISAQLYVPYVDGSPPGFAEATRSAPGDMLTWVDARRLLDAGQARHQAASAASRMRVRPEDPGQRSFHASGRLVTWQFFALFDTPFRAGGAWSATHDEDAARVVVLNGRLAGRLFGTDPAIGKSVRLNDHAFTVVGVLDDWYPRPLFHAGIQGDAAFAAADAYFIPLATALQLGTGFAGGMTCWSSDTARTGEGCAWLQFWVRLPTAGDARAYADFLEEDRKTQRARGRGVSSAPAALLDFDERMRRMRWVSPDVALQSWLALGLLGACIANAAALMMARTLRRTHEIGLRRAIGASARDIRWQWLAEAVGIGLAGGLVGALASSLAIWSLRQRATGHADLLQVDAALVLLAIFAAIASVVVASLLPIARAAGVSPAATLRAQ